MDENTPDQMQGEPALEETVTPGITEPEAEPVETDPDASGETPEPERTKQSGIDRRISKLVWAREEAERKAAYWEGRATGGQGQGHPQGSPKATEGPPKQDQFETYDDYLRALARHEISTSMAAERERLQAEIEQRELRGGFDRKVEAVREKHKDFDDVVMNPELEISVPMRDALMNSDDGPEMAYYLGNHPEESSRIARLNPYHQMLELGRISARLAAPPARKREASAAPPPIVPVRPVGKAVERLSDEAPIGDWMTRRNRAARGR